MSNSYISSAWSNGKCSSIKRLKIGLSGCKQAEQIEHVHDSQFRHVMFLYNDCMASYPEQCMRSKGKVIMSVRL